MPLKFVVAPQEFKSPEEVVEWLIDNHPDVATVCSAPAGRVFVTDLIYTSLFLGLSIPKQNVVQGFLHHSLIRASE